jgi:sugar phosphate isomerase/epimerase
MLDGVKAAGFRVVGLQTPTGSDPFAGAAAKREYLAALKDKIAARGLTAFQGRLQTRDTAPEADEAMAIRQQIDNAKFLGLRTLINTGTAKADAYAKWYRAMALAAAYGADHGVEIVVKPHGGVTATAADLLICLEKVNHPNFRLWYDAGNVIYYTGKDPVAELEPIVGQIKAFTAKDCAAKGAEVMTQFGTGKVDFVAIFRRLKKAGFAGPIVVESCTIGATAAETTANARANREFLERTIAAI